MLEMALAVSSDSSNCCFFFLNVYLKLEENVRTREKTKDVCVGTSKKTTLDT
jgi:hypothetical protein